MGELIPFPISFPDLDKLEPWERSDPLAVNGYWVSCATCKNRCFRAGHYFIACQEHSKYGGANNESR